MKNRIILSIIAVSLAFIGVQALSSNQKPACINIYVDFGSLAKNTKITKCITTFDGLPALQVFKDAEIKLSGTDKYGDKIVCRVLGLPDSTREKCATMPPENAYWAVLIKREMTIADPFPKWGWAQSGINDVYLTPGDSIGLVFTENGKVRWPS